MCTLLWWMKHMIVGAHIEESTYNKIVKGEYVDFGKLLPRDRALAEEDGRMQLVIRGGQSFWTPVSDAVHINGFGKWEQAFRVFSNIYTKAYPHRASEMIQYNHIIHTIAQTYVWDNVYLYDKEFRLHMAKNPSRSWAVILQQAWAFHLRDRHGNQGHHYEQVGSNSNHSGNGRGKVNEPCRKFNLGRCNYGTNCKYEHKCSYCFKFGHPIHTCRKMQADKERGQGKFSNEGNRAGGSTGPHPPSQSHSSDQGQKKQ